MNQAARTVSKNTGALFLGSGLKMFFSFAFVIVAAWKLGAQGFGEYELSVHYLELFVSLIATAVGILITREIARDRTHVDALLSAALVLVLLLTVLGAAVLLLVPGVFGYSERTSTALTLVTLALLPAAIASFLEAVFVALEAAHFVTLGTLIEGVVRVVLGIALLAAGFGVISLVVVLIVSRACLLLFYVGYLRKHLVGWKWSFRAEMFWRLCREWRAFAAENWLTNLSQSAGVIVLSAFHPEAVVGLFFAANKVMRLGAVVASSYTTAVFPHMSRLHQKSAQSLQRLTTSSLKFMLIGVLPLVVAVSIFADRVVALLFTPEYAAAAPILRVLVWLLLLTFINPFLSHILFARGQQTHSMMVAAIRLTARLATAFLLIPGWAGVGAAWSAVIAASCAALVFFYFVLRDGEAKTTCQVLAWASVPAVLLAIFLIALHDLQIVALLAMGAILYLVLLIVMRIISFNDLQSLQKLRTK